MKTENFWTDSLQEKIEIPTTDLPSEADIAIVGSGYTGLNAAIVLAKAGANVVVLEEHSIGWGASSRNGGMLTPGLKLGLEKIAKKYGMEKARYFWQWSVDAVEHVADIVAEEEIDCDFERTGHAALAFKPEHFEGYKTFKNWMEAQFGYRDIQLVGPGEIQAEIGSHSYFGGWTSESSLGLQPAKYVFGLGQAAARHGAQLVEHAKVLGIHRIAGGKFGVATSKGTVLAGEVLLATNGYTTGLVRNARKGIFPVGSYIIVTPPLSPELQASVSPKKRMFYDSKWFLNYFRLTPDGRMLFGGRNDLSTDLDVHESARRLQKRMVEVYPQLAGVPITHTWTGHLGVTFDLMPHIGQVDGIHYAYGYGGHGVSIGSFLGKEVGMLLAGKASDSPFRQLKHPRSFITQYDKLYLPLVAAWYRFLDKVQ